ncbi:PLP-dependent aminotransferase family protein [Deinococcus metallilatus]|uniref:2-aminoadipate transaminase n=1 Tax=Deinococcus metallilatus TaxID=1211322 RepID=A0AAJ5F697_9DEIO|nr:PLP-dependent aminotransferase family protein [Deinococcus metallilatus]MBB5296156.1 2-aminoadipate transaminase [Deinococcus metallilatus]QBY09793.1 PLP-dependent aminotransferase family protein [Deinococcus metallilatus]RXJ08791.1 PLP-dependent aminotransferase family protein [Deinococcus metallilatus]TLK23270.1 PLP-dependent aminotransferase family protein [Deinococcus metallilatus]GMA14022.1 2-aminoadipate aminotransferase [Deinococcus metallilatus]
MTSPASTLPPVDLTARLADRARRMNASAIREILKVTQQPDVISFAGGLPAPELFPLEDVRRATETVLSKYGPAALQYSTTEGHLPLREWIAARDGISPANVQIVTGSQQGLDLLGKILINEGDVVLVEAPTYLGALQSFQPYGPRYVELPTDEHGIDTGALEDVLKAHPAKLLYAIPNFQNPTGRTLSLERRRRLLELTAQYGVLVIEDDPYGKLRFTGEELPSLYALGLEMVGGDPNRSHVIYSSSFSKTLVPGLRDAWVQAARPIIEKLVQAKQGADLHTPTLNQMIVAELVGDVLPRQVEIVKKAYGERAQDMMARLREHFPAGVDFTTPEGGMFLWVTVPEGIDTVPLLAQAVERKVAFVPGSPFYALGGGHNTMRLSYSSATPEQIDRGIRALGETIRAAME